MKTITARTFERFPQIPPLISGLTLGSGIGAIIAANTQSSWPEEAIIATNVLGSITVVIGAVLMVLRIKTVMDERAMNPS